MATITRPAPSKTLVAPAVAGARNPVVQAFWLLRFAFTVAPIAFGVDKFLNWLVDWRIYLAPRLNDVIPGHAHQAMLAVGAIEIIAGIVVATKPRFGAYLVAAWLGGIILTLLLLGDFYDVALRDFGLLLGALTLARLAAAIAVDGTPTAS